MAMVEAMQVSADDTVSEHVEKPVSFGHHVIYAGEKFDEMVTWYSTLMNGTVTAVEGTLPPDLVAREDLDMVIIVKKDDVAQNMSALRTGIFHVAWSYASLAELMHVYKHARDNGIMPLSLLNTGILLQFYYIDPEGNGFEIEVDAHDTSEETQAAQRAAEGARKTNHDHWRYDAEKILLMMAAGWSDHDILDHDKYHAAVKAGQF